MEPIDDHTHTNGAPLGSSNGLSATFVPILVQRAPVWGAIDGATMEDCFVKSCSTPLDAPRDKGVGGWKRPLLTIEGNERKRMKG